MKTKYYLCAGIVLFALLSGCSIGYDVLTDISDHHNQYDKYGHPEKEQDFDEYTAEREKRISEERLAEEQRIKNATRSFPTVDTKGDTTKENTTSGDTGDEESTASEMNDLEN
jgi:hypothetical protein